jgi:glycosyltransferase involved in cell wall biosynthesis
VTDVDLVVISRTLGGTERRFARAVVGLASRGLSVRYVCPAGLVPSLAGTGLDTSMRLVAIPGRFAFDEAHLTAAAMWLSALRRRTIHACLTAILAAAFLPPRPRLVVSLTAARPELIGVGGRRARWYWQAARRARVVDCLAPEMADAAAANGVAARRLRVGPGSFVDASAFVPGTKEPLVAFVGRFVETKQPLLFLEAAARVSRRHPDARFVMIGEGPLEEAVRQCMTAHGIADKVAIASTVDVAPFLARSIVFASLQEMENYPSQSLLEAMSAGNAIVATDVGRTGQLVNGSTGLRVPSEPGAVADAISAFLSDWSGARSAGEAARDLVRSQYRMEPYLNYLEDVYSSVG